MSGCYTCGGFGERHDPIAHDQQSEAKDCPDCHGYGYIATEPDERNEFRFLDCVACGGTGIKVPA